jgi:peroxiredoxin
MKSRWIAAIAAASALALLIVPLMLHTAQLESRAKTPAASTPPKKSETIANLDLVFKDMNGAEVRLADYKGKVILLNVWATWCGPCELEIPELIEAYSKYKDKGLVVLGISLDDPAETLRAYAPKKNMNYPLLLWDDKFDDAYGPIVGVPITFFIDRDGTITRRHFGPVTKERIDQEIKPLL